MAAARRLAVVLWALLSLSGLAAAGPDVQYAALDRLYVKAKEPLPVVPGKDPLVLLMYHSYPTPLHNLRMSSETKGVAVAAGDPAVREMLPTVIIEVPVNVKVAKLGKVETLDLEIAVSVDEVKKPAALSFTLPMSARAATDLQQQSATPVGEIEVAIEPHANVPYAAYVTVSVVLIGLLIGRRMRTERERG